jgi:hypothetical protein
MSVASPFTPGSWLAPDGRWYPSTAHPGPLPGTGETDLSAAWLAPDSLGVLDDADLLDALNEAQRNVPARDDVTHRPDAWQEVVRLMRELERRYPPASLAEESPDGGDRVASREAELRRRNLPPEARTRTVRGGHDE